MNNARYINRVSRLFQPITVLQKDVEIQTRDAISKSQKLMIDNGIIKQSSPGNYHLLPLGVRALQKLTSLIDNEMRVIDAQKVVFPTLTNAKLWQTSGRYKEVANELFKLQDRHGSEYILSPTHEEAVADLIASIGLVSYKHYPLKLYQISSKFRDEMKPRFGLMRARQFVMKDLYSFDVDTKHAYKTYEEICESYNRIFNKLGVNWVRVLGSSGNMGGNLSHEYHYLSDMGEDKILQCLSCNYAANLEYLHKSNTNTTDKCPSCSGSNVQIKHGIEVGHTFLLGDRYSRPLHCKYLGDDGKSHNLEMGSYGLGVTRMLAASIEVLSGQNTIHWPTVLAPFQIVVIGPKDGSKEENKVQIKPEELYLRLNELDNLEDNILYDDRSEMTIGKRLLQAKRTGYLFVVVIGNKATQSPPLVEVIDVYNDEQSFMSLDQLMQFFQSNCLSLSKVSLQQ